MMLSQNLLSALPSISGAPATSKTAVKRTKSVPVFIQKCENQCLQDYDLQNVCPLYNIAIAQLIVAIRDTTCVFCDIYCGLW